MLTKPSQLLHEDESVTAKLDSAFQIASLKIIEKIKLCLVNEQLFTKDYCDSLVFTNPLELLEFIKTNLLNSIIQSKDPKVHNLKNCFDEGWQLLKNEIQNTLDNDTYCIAYRNHLNDQIRETKCNSFYEFIHNDCFKQLSKKNDDHITFLEQWSSVGHPVHPCYKSKSQMSIQEVLDYSPEFFGTINLKIVAVHDSIFKVQMPTINIDYKSWFAKNFPDCYEIYLEEFVKLNLNPQEYNLIPVHPWQVDHVIPEWFKPLFQNNHLILLKDAFIASSSSLSFRSMMPLDKNTPNIKIPITSQITSVIRYISPAKLYNSVYLSKLIKEILKEEGYFENTINFIDENICVTLTVSDKDQISENSTRHLSAIYREKPINFIDDNEIGVPLNAIFLESPITNKPLLIEFIEKHKLIDINNKESSTRKYFKDYASKTIKGPLGTYFKYGINLECHQQNTILVFKEGILQRSLIRDSSGIDIYKPSFDTRGIKLELHPQTNQYYYDRSLRVHLIHCLFRSHLSNIIKLLSETYKIDKNKLWSDLYTIVEKEIENYKDYLSKEELAIEKKAFFKDEWSYKALMLMRIANTKEIFIKSENPFWQVISQDLEWCTKSNKFNDELC